MCTKHAQNDEGQDVARRDMALSVINMARALTLQDNYLQGVRRADPPATAQMTKLQAPVITMVNKPVAASRDINLLGPDAVLAGAGAAGVADTKVTSDQGAPTAADSCVPVEQMLPPNFMAVGVVVSKQALVDVSGVWVCLLLLCCVGCMVPMW